MTAAPTEAADDGGVAKAGINCSNCGALLPAGYPGCPYCGAAIGAGPAIVAGTVSAQAYPLLPGMSGALAAEGLEETAGQGFFRAAGSVRVIARLPPDAGPHPEYRMYLDTTFRIIPAHQGEALLGVALVDSSVDFSPQGVVFEIRDAADRALYRHPSYEMSSTSIGSASLTITQAERAASWGSSHELALDPVRRSIVEADFNDQARGSAFKRRALVKLSAILIWIPVGFIAMLVLVPTPKGVGTTQTVASLPWLPYLAGILVCGLVPGFGARRLARGRRAQGRAVLERGTFTRTCGPLSIRPLQINAVIGDHQVALAVATGILRARIGLELVFAETDWSEGGMVISVKDIAGKTRWRHPGFGSASP